jgi:FAD/FMN-containing dehydrogenase
MRARSLNGNEIDIEQGTIDGLKMRLRGPVLVPDDHGYEEARTVWNAMIDKKPAFIARCIGNADVIECVRFAREHDLLLCIKAGGHNIAGLAAADGALMLDLSHMRGAWVDSERNIVRAQGGCLLGDVDRETQVHGLAAVLGFVSLTGCAGLTLGGGFGYLTKRYGWTSDNVVGMDVVTADAKLVHASSEENADLFWGLRGGGGNFGVVTGIDYALYPRPGGVARERGAEGSGVLPDFRRRGPARAHSGHADASGAARAVATAGHARKADRGNFGLLFR